MCKRSYPLDYSRMINILRYPGLFKFFFSIYITPLKTLDFTKLEYKFNPLKEKIKTDFFFF